MVRVNRAAAMAAGLLLATACGGEHRPASGAGDSTPSAAPSPSASADAGAATPSSRPPLRDPVQLSVTAAAGGKTGSYSGLGECHHTTDASIYDVPATMWSSTIDTESGDLRYLSLTLWQPRAGGDLQVSLGVTLGETTHQIATVKRADTRGSGTGRVAPKGQGGTLTVEGSDAEGRPVRVTVDCSTFTEPVAEGG